jgi:hypothetical protein
MYLNTQVSVKENENKLEYAKGQSNSPNLFKLFVNDLPDIFTQDCDSVKLNSINLNCLMYADDVILISETASGLQNCLNQHSKYCERWNLEINTPKSKAMVFNNRGRLKTDVLKFNSSIIENVRSYTYLGITFSVSGAFTEAKPQHLYKKGLKAYFKLIQSFDGHKPNIKTLIHIFDHTVKPVLMYGSEIWGYFHGFRLSSKDNVCFIKLFNSFPLENIHKTFCKYVLEVNKRTTNIGVMGELGRYPLMLEVLLNMLSYYVRLLNSDEILLKEAFFVSEQLVNENKGSWTSCVKAISRFLGLSPVKFKRKLIRHKVIKLLQEKYILK